MATGERASLRVYKSIKYAKNIYARSLAASARRRIKSTDGSAPPQLGVAVSHAVSARPRYESIVDVHRHRIAPLAGGGRRRRCNI